MEKVGEKSPHLSHDRLPDPVSRIVTQTQYITRESVVVHYVSSGIICGKLSYISWYITTFLAVFELVFYQKKIGTYFPLCATLSV